MSENRKSWIFIKDSQFCFTKFVSLKKKFVENFNISTNTRISAKVAKVLQAGFFLFPQFYDIEKLEKN